MDPDTRRAFGALVRVVSALRTAVGQQGVRVDVIVSNVPRTTTVDISGVLANSTTTKTATWSVPVLSDYRVVIQPVIASARLGTLFAVIATGTKTATSVDILVVNAAGSTLVAGSLDVVIHPA